MTEVIRQLHPKKEKTTKLYPITKSGAVYVPQESGDDKTLTEVLEEKADKGTRLKDDYGITDTFISGGTVTIAGKSMTVIDNLTSTSTILPLSAKQGKVLSDKIDEFKGNSGFVGNWDCTTGKPVTDPEKMPYIYSAGDTYLVAVVASAGGVNYKPDGVQYSGEASTEVETDSRVAVSDTYIYNGTDWLLLFNHSAVTVDSTLDSGSTNPVENKVIKSAIDTKADSANVYTKTVADSIFATKTELSNVKTTLEGEITDLDTAKADKATTIAGYNIGDAYIDDSGITLGNKQIKVIDNINTPSSGDVLSARMGKELQDEINNLKAIGRFLSIWNCATGTPTTEPTVNVYPYQTGDYFLIGAVAESSGATSYNHVITISGQCDYGAGAYEVAFNLNSTRGTSYTSITDITTELASQGYIDHSTLTASGTITNSTEVKTVSGVAVESGVLSVLTLHDDTAANIGGASTFTSLNDNVTSVDVNYKPAGISYIKGTVQRQIETETDIAVSDTYVFDGTNWALQKNHARQIAVDSALDSGSTNPVENRVIYNRIKALEDTDPLKEDKSNKTGVIDSGSTETQYPNAKVTYTKIKALEDRVKDLESHLTIIDL